MNINMYRTAKSLELVEVEIYGCFILCSYLFLHKTLIIQTKTFINVKIKDLHDIKNVKNHIMHDIKNVNFD